MRRVYSCIQFWYEAKGFADTTDLSEIIVHLALVQNVLSFELAKKACVSMSVVKILFCC